jgi:signal transduction histidine kinase
VLIEERKHTVSTDASVRPMNVRGDPLLLHGIVDEILLNAVAYTKEKGKITVHVAKKRRILW